MTSSNPSSPGTSSASDDFVAMLDEELRVAHESGDEEDVVDTQDGSVEDAEEQEHASEGDDSEDKEDVASGSDVEDIDLADGVEDNEVGRVGLGELDGGGLGSSAPSGDQAGLMEDFRSGEGRKRKREKEELEDSAVLKSGCPPHPGFMWGVCIRCGENRETSNSEPAEAGVSLRYIHEGLELTETEAARMRRHELKRVIGRKKLYLVLDLDHTLLNSARFIEVAPDEESYLASCYVKDTSTAQEYIPGAAKRLAGPMGNGNLEYVKGLHKLNHLQMWTKLRPYVHEFLEAASKLFEMYVYTMGERTYAVAMARLLDPTGRYFGDRVISQGDSTRRHAKDLDVVLGAESAVVILDDTEGVWPKHRRNLMLMERYHFFRSSCRQFGLRSLSLTEKRRDESEGEGTLATALSTLRSLHLAVFGEMAGVCISPNALRRSSASVEDVRKVLQILRKKVLEGCRIVFSRLFPTGMRDMEQQPFWKLTEELGASCSNTLHQDATHVVALDRGTDKARWAKKHGRYLVHPAWIEAAQYLWRRPREEEFPVSENPDSPVTTFAKTVDVAGYVNVATVVSPSKTINVMAGTEPSPDLPERSSLNDGRDP